MSFLSRRPPVTPARVLVASGQKLDLTARKATQRKRQQWQDDAWHYRDSIGEIRYAMAFLKYCASRVRLVPALANEDGEPPTPLDEAEGVPPGVLAAARDALARLTSGTYNYAELLAPYAENLEVPGECYLAGYLDGGGDVQAEEKWEIRSVSELQPGDRGYKLIDSPGARDGRDLDPATSYVARLWTPHPRWKALADSPMRSLLDPCEELALVSRLIRRESRSRLAANGILFIDNALDFQGGGTVADPEDPDSDPWMDEFTRTVITPVEDEGDAASLVPIVLRGSLPEGRTVDSVIKHIKLTDVVPAELLNRMEAALKRIGMGLDVPPEIVTGMADVNHWTAWQVDDSTVRNHVEPLVIRMVDGLTAGYLRHVLGEYGVPAEWARRVVAWYDLSTLTQRPNRADDAKAGHASGVLSDEVLAEALGFDPTTDMPTEEELARRLALKQALDPALTQTLLQLLVLRGLPDVVQVAPPAIEAPAAPVEEEPTDDTGDGATPGPTTGLEGVQAAATPAEGPVLRAYTRESRRLADIDRTTRERLTTAMDAAQARALERAGNRVRTQANKDPEAKAIVASVHARQAPAALGPAMVAGLGLDPETLLAGAWDDLARQWDTWTATAREDALATAARIAGHDPADPAVAAALTAAAARLAELAADAWTWLSASLTAATLTALYNPDGAQDDVGEDPTPVGALTTLARGALALAGGLPPAAGGLTSEGLPAQPGTRPGGIGTGDILDAYLRDAGVQVLGYEWVYGISQRHFEPHRRLDGVVFRDFDSPLLRNPTSWPAAILAPGDHKGCHCDAQPVYADGPASADLDAVGDATYDPAYMDVLRALAAGDLEAGRTDTDAVRTVAEADRIAQHRPSKRS